MGAEKPKLAPLETIRTRPNSTCDWGSCSNLATQARLWIRDDVLCRFKAEAHIMTQLNHTNVVKILDFNDSDQPFIVMELAKGGSANDLLESIEKISAIQAFAIVDGVLSGLIHIHALGIIHKDIKPGNILLTESGIPKLADFGIAHTSEHNLFHNKTTPIAGTIPFMAPEQRSSATAVTEASDLYSVGATLYTLLTRGPTLELHNKEKQNKAFNDLRKDIREFLSKACAFHPSERFLDASEMQLALRKIPQIPNTQLTQKLSISQKLTSPIPFATTQLIGKTVNKRYKIKAILNSGKITTVYQAQDQLLNQTVALKMLTPKRAKKHNIWLPVCDQCANK
tara:strand:+ start:478 stop:1497 length:1020 start_codon:yes stop_codon:yes gene_type:complete